jgi:lipopolysaccharide export system protein LptA
MPLSITRLRRWIAALAIVFPLSIAGVYFYARHRVQNTLRQIPQKMGLDIQQTAEGFTISKSEQGRTLFKVQASKAVQFKRGGHTELHNVSITMYGRDATRFDRISGDDFEYDPQSGDVTANGEVQIELEANPEGLAHPDQSTPDTLRNPIYLKTSGLVFNQKTGNAFTRAKVEFETPQAIGSAVGVRYAARDNLLSLESQVKLTVSGTMAASISASHGTIAKDPRVIQLENPEMEKGTQRGKAQHATVFLNADNVIQKILASGRVEFQDTDEDQMYLQAAQMEMGLSGTKSQVQSTLFSGGVDFSRGGDEAVAGNSGKLRIEFGPNNEPRKVRAEDNVRVAQHPAKPGPNAQNTELTAAAVNVLLGKASHPEHAETEGAAQIEITPTTAAGQKTVVSAGKFDARFDSRGQLAGIHGEPDARIVNTASGQPDRVSTSTTLDALFQPGSGLLSLVQQGLVKFTDGIRQASSERARYTVADQILELTGSPRVFDGSMTTTAQVVKMNRATGDALAEGDVKTTYSDLKPQPNGALLASDRPIHVTAHSMTVHRSPAVALYKGSVRLWQDANAVEAPVLEFDRERRSVVAHGTPQIRVVSVLAQAGSDGKSVPVTIKSGDLTYTDSERRIHFADGAQVNAEDMQITSAQMDAFLKGADNRSDPGSGRPAASRQGAAETRSQTAQLDRIVATGAVVITQPTRHAEGDLLVYTADDDKFVLTGGPPSIFDAERGKVTGVSLTFHKRDDTVVVEGTKANPTVTQTRVAR